jgi:hypothetical protein
VFFWNVQLRRGVAEDTGELFEELQESLMACERISTL